MMDKARFDVSAMLQRLDDDEELVEDLLSMFLDLRESLVLPIEAAVKQRNASSLHETAHRLKGSLNEIHALDAVQLASRSETAAREENIEKAVAWSVQLIDETNAVAEDVTRWLQRR